MGYTHTTRQPFFDGEGHPIPRRRSALSSFPTTNVPATTRRRSAPATHVGYAPKSAVYRPHDREYRIPLTDGTEMHVTEYELADLPQQYQEAAQLVNPLPPLQETPVPVPPRSRRSPPPQTPYVDTPEVIYAPAARPRSTEAPVPRYQQGFQFPRFHWLFWLGIALLLVVVLLAGWVGISTGGSWYSTWQNDQHYGRPRTFQIDAVVGHDGDSPQNPSHFIALNLNRHIEIIEIPAGDAAKARMYLGPTLYGDGQDLLPVTLSFRDVNGDGKPDMLIQFGSTIIAFLNTGDGFRPQKPGEHVTL